MMDDVVLVLLFLALIILTTFSSFSIVELELVNVSWLGSGASDFLFVKPWSQVICVIGK